jgi:hypothetical protein
MSSPVGSPTGVAYASPAGGCFVTALLAGGSGSTGQYGTSASAGTAGAGALFAASFWAPSNSSFIVTTAASAVAGCGGGAATGISSTSGALFAVAAGGGGANGYPGGSGGAPGGSGLPGGGTFISGAGTQTSGGAAGLSVGRATYTGVVFDNGCLGNASTIATSGGFRSSGAGSRYQSGNFSAAVGWAPGGSAAPGPTNGCGGGGGFYGGGGGGSGCGVYYAFGGGGGSSFSNTSAGVVFSSSALTAAAPSSGSVSGTPGSAILTGCSSVQSCAPVTANGTWSGSPPGYATPFTTPATCTDASLTVTMAGTVAGKGPYMSTLSPRASNLTLVCNNGYYRVAGASWATCTGSQICMQSASAPCPYYCSAPPVTGVVGCTQCCACATAYTLTYGGAGGAVPTCALCPAPVWTLPALVGTANYFVAESTTASSVFATPVIASAGCNGNCFGGLTNPAAPGAVLPSGTCTTFSMLYSIISVTFGPAI